VKFPWGLVPHEHDWGMVPVTNGFRLPAIPEFGGLVEHRAQCLKCGKRPAYRSSEYEQCQRRHDQRVNVMLEARGE